ncbi:MAG: cytochrome c biosis protein CcmG, thiol:disulfide interchange protein DsbE [Acidobacteriota bacterium]|jgi:cytochrome c biogenesis protein CcmG/thiol:disulfide interchange protein DsbE|nr:cytochrome c biosis protein CcmG, thiol:disulfide interchange protein DsbE [Acidobacteriota bacterium]
MTKFILPLALFLVLVVFLAIGLSRDPHEIPSPLVDKPAPAFALPVLSDPQQSFKLQEMRGKVWLLNAWASWCVACREEHPVLLELSRSGVVPIYGLDYKDERQDALAWLDEFGNPYTQVLSDADGRVGIDYGVYGVPETFVIDRNGVIRYKQIGPITEEALEKKIIPLVKELQK